MRRASPRGPARQPERLSSKTARSTGQLGNKGSDAIPPNHERHPRSRLYFWQATRDRGTRQPTNQPPAPDRRDFVTRPVGDADGWVQAPPAGVTNRLILAEAKPAGCWQGAGRIWQSTLTATGLRASTSGCAVRI